MTQPLKLAVLISGGGTTLKNLIQRIEAGSLGVSIELVISSSASAGGLQLAKDASIESKVINWKKIGDPTAFSDAVFEAIRSSGADLVVMGGFLRQLSIAKDFENRIINIHPSLIPAFSGKGFYLSLIHI